MSAHFGYLVLKFTSSLCFQLGTDGILLGAETLRGLYPIEAVTTVGRICAEVSSNIPKLWNQMKYEYS